LAEAPEDENDLFAASIAAQLKKLSPRKGALAKLKIQKVLVDAVITQHERGGGGQDESTPQNNSALRVLQMDEY